MLDDDARRFIPLVHVDEALHRPRLLQSVASAPPATARITVLVAPAGYGKTTLLAQLAEQARQAGHAVAWLNCDERDRDAGHFTTDLEQALARAWTPGRRPLDASTGLGRLIAGFDRPLLVCVDEFEAAGGSGVDALFERLAPEMAADQQILLATRDAPGPRFTRLQLAGLLRRIDVEALRFDRDEARQLIGGCVPEVQQPMVLSLAEGWPLALQLARLRATSGRHDGTAPSPGRPVGAIPRQQLFDYLAREVIDHLPAPLLALLHDTAILESFDPPLADRLRDRQDSHALVRDLHRLKPIISIDEVSARVRLHPLLREYLLAHTPAEAQARRTALHARAADLLSERRQWHDAVSQAVAAGRLTMAADLIEEAGGVRLCADQGALRVRLLLEQLPEATVRQRPRLGLLRLGQMLAEQNPAGARQAFERIEQQLHDSRALADAVVRSELELTRCMLLIHDSERELRFSPWAALAEAHRAARRESITDPRMLVITLALELLFLHRYGPTQRGERRTEEIERLYDQGAYTYNSPWLWMYRARNALARGRLAQAERILREELPSDDTFVRFRQDSLSHLVQAMLGRISLLQGDAEAATARLSALREESSMHLLEITAAAWVDAARAEHALGRSARAWELIEAARQRADDEDLVLLGQLAAATQVELRLRDGDIELARSSAQSADLDGLWRLAQAPFALPWLLVEALARAQVRLALALGQTDEAEHLISVLQAKAVEAGQRLGELLAAGMLLLVRLQCGGARGARAELERVLALGAEAGALQVFLELGGEAMTALRSWLPTAADPGTALREHAQRLLQCWEQGFRLETGQRAASPLTPREIDVLRALAVDGSTKLAARRLLLSPETVKHHLKNIFTKLGVRTRDEAVAEARRRSLMP